MKTMFGFDWACVLHGKANNDVATRRAMPIDAMPVDVVGALMRAISSCSLRPAERDRQRHPCIPSFGPMLSVELPVSLEIDIPLVRAVLEEPPRLGAEPGHLRFEVAEHGAFAAVARP